MNMEISKLKFSYELLTPKIRNAIISIPEPERNRIQEIRLRLSKMLTVTLYGKEYFVDGKGRLMNNYSDGIPVAADDIAVTYKRALQNSVHSFHREISRGYITAEGGNRVGFCGTAVLDPSKDYAVDSIKNISSINIRIAREVKNCSVEIFEKTLSERPSSLIIAGPPSSGKTTVLRDLCRIAGSFYRLSVIDERNELAATKDGAAMNDVGMMSDVFNSYNKYDGIMTAVKVMSPTILVCDEIGSKEDMKALEYAVNSGVKLIASCHASTIDELKKRPLVSKLIKEKVFDYCALLGTGPMCGKLTALYRLGDKYG
ncbi:stage III sporulation protein AA [Ruminococcus sp. Marseille-P6503]|uniref:stage III sporulation protein AA n=1 Tax=Ruminococcus sp. Marseille-P6503 TaxID=2364796 RepID=UPI000F52456E|nr:stage III sporulation protein AA [Ruminococcus sp. Marseille-P6503]